MEMTIKEPIKGGTMLPNVKQSEEEKSIEARIKTADFKNKSSSELRTKNPA